MSNGDNTTIWRCPECGSPDCPGAFNHVPFRPAYWRFWMMRAMLWIMYYAKKSTARLRRHHVGTSGRASYSTRFWMPDDEQDG